ncbi:50S ribosomal protein L32 [Candidatus Dependentiae bacterium]|nr:50S ribosomal protein L32 [Candidatus Dependentiae bacterium]
MPVPKRKTSKARRDKRAAGKKETVVIISRCQTCNAPVLPHQVCKECGHYKGIKIIRTKTDRMYERNQARQAKQKANAPVGKPMEQPAEQAPKK